LKVHCAVQPGQKKTFKVDDSEYSRLSDHIGRFPVVIISPADRDLLSEGSALRRKFLDGMVSQADRTYLENWMQYQRTVQQRNALLKYFAANRVFSEDQLAVYDLQMAALAPGLHAARKAFAASFAPELKRFYALLSGGQEEVDWQYESDLNEAPMETLLQQARAKDRVLQYTSVGLHKDDLVFTLNGRPLKKVGSQGQQKSYLVAVKLAQFARLTAALGRKPLLLLDDVFDKLDAQRVEALVSLVRANEFGQIFLTDTHPDRTEALVKRMDETGNVVNL
jgi:DNA replication and repair protein RecF